MTYLGDKNYPLGMYFFYEYILTKIGQWQYNEINTIPIQY